MFSITDTKCIGPISISEPEISAYKKRTASELLRQRFDLRTNASYGLFYTHQCQTEHKISSIQKTKQIDMTKNNNICVQKYDIILENKSTYVLAFGKKRFEFTFLRAPSHFKSRY